MTPDEMKVLARVANRNATDSDSPVVVDDSRLIAPIDVNSDELPLSFEKIDARLDILETIQDAANAKVNELEGKLGIVLAENDTPVKVLASVVAQTRSDLAELKSVKDTMKLNPADVLSGVIKPTRIGSTIPLVHSTFQVAGHAIADNKIDGVDANNKASSIRIRVFKDLETRPKNIRNLDGFGAAGVVLNKISGAPRAIDGYVKVASNSGIEEIDLSDKDFENSAHIRKIEMNPLETDAVYEVPSANTINVFESSGAIDGSKSISVNTFTFNGVFSSVSGLNQNAPLGYALVTSSNTGRYYIWKHATANAQWTAVTSTTEFTTTALSNNNSVDVLFAGTSGEGQLVGLRYTSAAPSSAEVTNYYWNAPSQFDPLEGAIHLINDRLSTNKYIVRPSNKVAAAHNMHQRVTLIKPSSSEYFRFGSTEKYAKCAAVSGEISLDIASSGNTYLIDNNQIYLQGPAAIDSRVRLDIHEWVFNNITRKFITNSSSSAQGFVPAGYYNLNDKLVKMDGAGNVVYDRTKGEVILYKFKNNKSFKLTVPTITTASTMAQILEPKFDLVTQVSEELFVDSDFKLRSQNKAVVTDRVGLRYVFGDENFSRANKLYDIDAEGKCTPYTGLAYLQIEEDNASFGMRVWYTCTSGEINELVSGEYLNSNSNRVFKVSTTKPAGTYSSGNIADLPQSGILQAITKTRNNLLLESTQISVEGLGRFSGEKLANIVKYQTLGLIAGGNKSTIEDVVLLGGVELINGIGLLYNGKFLRVMSGSDYEIVHITVAGNVAIANKTNLLINGSKLVEISNVLYNIDTANNHKLVKVTSGYIFNDDADEKDIRAIKEDGTKDNTLTATSDCLHFAWVDSLDNKKKVYWVDTDNANRLEPVEKNTSYFHGTKSSGVYDNIVFLVKKPLTAYVAEDEESSDDSTSSYTMHILNLETGTFKELPVPDITNNNNGKGWIFRGDQFNSVEFKSMTNASQLVYWHRDSGNNKPYINRVISDGANYNTDSFGLRSAIAMIIDGMYFVGPDNTLLIGNSSGQRVSDVAAVKNKHYIDYDGNLAKSSSQSGSRAQITSGNYFVVFDNNDFRSRYYNNGRIVLVTAGDLIAVSSTAHPQSNDHIHNGLKMWGKDATGVFNRWLHIKFDVNPQSNDSAIINTNIQEIYTSYVDSTGADLEKMRDTPYISVDTTTFAEITSTDVLLTTLVELTGTGIGGQNTFASRPAASSTAGAGDTRNKYFFDTTNSVLYIGNSSTGAWETYPASAGSPVYIIDTASSVWKVVAAGAATILTTGTTPAAATTKYIYTSDSKLRMFATADGSTNTATAAAVSKNILNTSTNQFYTVSTGAKPTTASGLFISSAASFTFITSKYYTYSADGSNCVKTPLVANQSLLTGTTVSSYVYMLANVAADTLLVAADYADANNTPAKRRLKFRDGFTGLVTLTDFAKWSDATHGGLVGKNGVVYKVDVTTQPGNTTTSKVLVIDGVPQSLPRGTQILIDDLTNVRTFTKVGNSKLQATANGIIASSTTIGDNWRSN